ncbi:MAG: tetratricopeptide repeat protein [Deltaproteobacteria bacterium]|nr:tetratricopeptide repeat protein [Deltaproteobacteria bacterium]MBW2065542.1 tetratricopeptide repeat protein [Deltaproteobacteria bacterium]
MLMRKDPGHMPNPLELARSYIDEGDEHRAQQIVLGQRHRLPDHPDVHAEWGRISEELGMARQAMEFYEGGLKLDPGNRECLYLLARLLNEVGHFERSNHYLRKILRKDRDNAASRKLLHDNYEAMGLKGQASAVLSGEGKAPASPERYFPPSVSKNQVDIFLDFFSGREIGFALQEVDPDTGTSRYVFHETPLSHDIVRDHILGKSTVAAYPLRSDNVVRYTGLFARIPNRVRETYAGQQSYLILLDEKIKSYVGKLAVFAKSLGIPAYPEDYGGLGARLWFFFEDYEHFLRAREFLKAFIKIAPEPETQYGLEMLLPTRPTGIGWVEQCIPLPLGINRLSLRRCLFLDDDGHPWDEQLGFIKKIRRFSLRPATKRLRCHDTSSKPWNGKALAFTDRIERLRSACPVVALLMDRALAGRILRREEKVALYYSIGLLDETGNAIHRLFEPAPDYSYSKVQRQWERLQKNPISCLKIRLMLPEITSSLNCQCIFDLRGGKYPSPLMHVMPHMVPTSCEFKLPNRLKLKQAAHRYVQLRRHLDEERRVISRLEALLQEHFSAKGISEFKVNDIKIRRESVNGQTAWRLEHS